MQFETHHNDGNHDGLGMLINIARVLIVAVRQVEHQEPGPKSSTLHRELKPGHAQTWLSSSWSSRQWASVYIRYHRITANTTTDTSGIGDGSDDEDDDDEEKQEEDEEGDGEGYDDVMMW